MLDQLLIVANSLAIGLGYIVIGLLAVVVARFLWDGRT